MKSKHDINTIGVRDIYYQVHADVFDVLRVCTAYLSLLPKAKRDGWQVPLGGFILVLTMAMLLLPDPFRVV